MVFILTVSWWIATGFLVVSLVLSWLVPENALLDLLVMTMIAGGCATSLLVLDNRVELRMAKNWGDPYVKYFGISILLTAVYAFMPASLQSQEMIFCFLPFGVLTFVSYLIRIQARKPEKA